MDVPYNRAVAVVPSDSANFASIGGLLACDAVYCGGAGIVQGIFEDGYAAAFTVVAGQILPVKLKRINATSTTATLMLALYRV